MAKSLGKILIVDDDHFSRDLYRDLLREDGHEVQVANSEKEAKAWLQRSSFNVVITETRLPGAKPFGLLSFINEAYPHISVIFATRDSDLESAVYAFKSGAKDYLQKPVLKEELKLVAQNTLEQQILFRENQEFKSFLNLFDACHRISACIESERLFSLSLHVLGQELAAQNGLVVYQEAKGEPGMIPLVPSDKMDVPRLVNSLCEHLKIAKLTDLKELAVLENFPFFGKPHLMLLLPVASQEDMQAAFALFFDRAKNTSSREFLEKRAQFIARQVSISWDNARKYSYARSQANVDDVTGLFNARYLSIALEKEIKRARRFNAFLSVLFIDIDRFKSVNDEHGHLIGTQILGELAEVLRSCLRDIDIAVRYGGDEFTILLLETDSGGATKVAERIRLTVEAHTFLKKEGKNLHITVCIGISSFPEHATSVADLLEMADQAMYRGKKTTRNVVYIFNPNQ